MKITHSKINELAQVKECFQVFYKAAVIIFYQKEEKKKKRGDGGFNC